VVLFTDGMANVGIADLPRLAGMAGGAAKDAVSTSCIGFGADFNEDLLKGMADGGRGHFWYVESLDQMTGVFEEEIEGLVALAAQNVVVRVVPVHPDLHGVTHPAGLAVERDGLAWVVRLGDLLATSPRELPLRFHVENVGELGTVELARLEVIADVIRDGGILHQKVTLPIVANLDRSDRVVPVVEETFVRYEAVRARREAVERADRGDYLGAASALREAARKLEAYRGVSARSAELADDLVGEAERFAGRQYVTEDRKYHMARGAAEMVNRGGYVGKVARHRKSEPR
jgi:Ca-activated chloride channel family protein